MTTSQKAWRLPAVATAVLAGVVSLAPGGVGEAEEPQRPLIASPVQPRGLLLRSTEPVEPANIWHYQGEELIYSLEFFGAEMARGVLVVGQATTEEGQTVIPVSGMAVTEGVAAMVYPMRDEGTTLVAVDTGLAVTTDKRLDERGEFRRYQVDFQREAYRGWVTRLRRNVVTQYERMLPSNTHDAFSWIFVIREQDLTPNTTQVYYVYDGWKLSRVTATVQEDEEELWVGDELIRCRKISLYREVMDSSRPLPFVQETGQLPPALWVRENNRQGEQVGHLYISDDHRHLPVMVEFENALITAVARLISIEPPDEGY